jgi:two-component sensor histidine kinase
MRLQSLYFGRARAGLLGLILLIQPGQTRSGDATAQQWDQHAARATALALFDSARVTCQTTPSLALQHAHRGLGIARSLNDPRLISAGCLQAAEAHFQKGANDSAETCHREALQYAVQAGDDSLTAAALNNVGFIVSLRGDYEMAFEYCNSALKIAQREGYHKLAVRAYNNLGLTAQSFDKRVDDLSYFLLALPEAIAIGDTDGIAITHNHLGNYYGAKGMYDSSMVHYSKALALRERIETKTNSISVLLNNIGNILRDQEDTQGAQAYYARSLGISQQTGSKNLMATTYKNMAMLARKTKDYTRALEYARLARSISLEIFLHRIALLSTEEIARIFAERGDYQSAYAYALEYNLLKDSLANEANRRRAAELRVRFDSERKERQIQELALAQERTFRNFLIAIVGLSLGLGVMLFWQYRLKSKAARETALQKTELERLYGELVTNNARLQESDAELRNSLQEKEVLLKEIHHRVKNNLQIISSLLNLQSRVVSNDQVLGVLRESQDRIRSMALIHERLYSSSDFARIGLREYLRDLVDYLRNSYSTYRVTVEIEADPMPVNLDTAIPLGLIVSELVTNAFKHAFPDQASGVVTVSVRSSQNGQCTVEVKDNGKGLPHDFVSGNSSTLGVHLVQILAQQLGGELVTKNDNGACFTITFPFDQKA